MFFESKSRPGKIIMKPISSNLYCIMHFNALTDGDFSKRFLWILQSDGEHIRSDGATKQSNVR